MTFYQELQLDQAGSKSYISSFQKRKDKLKHTGIYLFKILLNVAFCTVFIALFCTLFGAENSVAGLTVLLVLWYSGMRILESVHPTVYLIS